MSKSVGMISQGKRSCESAPPPKKNSGAAANFMGIALWHRVVVFFTRLSGATGRISNRMTEA